MQEMTQEERRAFLMEGTRTGKIGVTRRDGRASVCVDEEHPPYAFVRISARARLGEDLTEMRLWARRIAARYMGEAAADRYAARNAVPGELLVRLVPDSLVGRKGAA